MADNHKVTPREILAVVVERINALTTRFDKFEENQKECFKEVSNRQEKALTITLENSKSINDLSHVVKLHSEILKEKRELSNKWKFAITTSLLGNAAFIIREVINFLLKGGIP